MKLITEYLADAAKFQRMASREKNPKLKAALEGQSLAYWKLARDHAKKLGLPEPAKPPKSK